MSIDLIYFLSDKLIIVVKYSIIEIRNSACFVDMCKLIRIFILINRRDADDFYDSRK